MAFIKSNFSRTIRVCQSHFDIVRWWGWSYYGEKKIVCIDKYFVVFRILQKIYVNKKNALAYIYFCWVDYIKQTRSSSARITVHFPATFILFIHSGRKSRMKWGVFIFLQETRRNCTDKDFILLFYLYLFSP